MTWEPNNHHSDPMVNAVLNLAEQMSECAYAIRSISRGLTYSPDSASPSIAEAMEMSAKEISASIREAATSADK